MKRIGFSRHFQAAQTAALPFAKAVHGLLLQAWLFAVFNQAYRIHPVVPLEYAAQIFQAFPYGFGGPHQLFQSEA